MAQKKRSIQLNKAMAHIKSSIKKSKWDRGDKIPAMAEISKCIDVCSATVRKAVTVLCNERLLQKEGRGFVVIGMPRMRFTSLQKTMTDARMSFRAAWLMNRGAFYDAARVAIILRTDKTIEILRPLSCEYSKFTVLSIKDTLENPITAKDVLNDNKLRGIYLKQCRVRKYMDIITSNTEKLGL